MTGEHEINLHRHYTRWRHQMETFSALLAICAGNSPVTGEVLQRPVTRSFDVYFYARPNKRLSTQSWRWWFETPLRPLWRHSNVIMSQHKSLYIWRLNYNQNSSCIGTILSLIKCCWLNFTCDIPNWLPQKHRHKTYVMVQYPSGKERLQVSVKYVCRCLCT